MSHKHIRLLWGYPGSKWTLTRQFEPHFPPHRHWVSVFGGTGAEIVRRSGGRSELETYNDLNGDIVRVFRVLQDKRKFDRLRHMIENTPNSRAEFDRACAVIYDEPNGDDMLRAWAILVIGNLGWTKDPTSANHLKSILANGLRPKGNGGGNWEEYPSRPDMVYLTDCYAFYFAAHAAFDADDSRSLVMELDTDRLDPQLFYPDEDYLARQLMREQGLSLEEIHPQVKERLEQCRGQWQDCLTNMATCCYRGIVPPAAFTRYCLLDLVKRPVLCAMSYDNAPFVSNDHDRYRRLTQWFFGDRKKLPRYVPTGFIRGMLKNGLLDLAAAGNDPNWDKEQRQRHGIEVVDCPVVI